MEKCTSEPIPDSILGVNTESLDDNTWDWVCRMKNERYQSVFENQVFVVTGGASGLGEKICAVCALLGARVFTLDISEAIESKFGQGRITGIRCNIAEYAEARQVIQEIGRSNGITKVVLNAGIFPNPRPKETEFDLNGFEEVMRINTFGNIAVCDAALPFLWARQNAEADPMIAIVGSRNIGIPSHASYTVSKAALVQYGYYLSRLESPSGSPRHRVYVEHPDAVFDTNVWGKTPEERRRAIEASAAKKGLSLQEYIDRSNPMKVSFTSWIVARSIAEMALPTNHGKHGVSVHHNGGVYVTDLR